MKKLFCLLAAIVFACAMPANAALYLVTAISTNTTIANTNYGAAYGTQETDHFISQTFQITHTNLITLSNLTLIYRVTYDGGATWANVTSTNAAFNSAGGTNWLASATNSSPDTWLPFGLTGANITRSNQVVAVNQTNSSYTVLSAWNN